MPTPEISDAVTQGIRVAATGFYSPEDSNPDIGNFVFGYRIVIHNEGEAPATLIARHWVIIDGDGSKEEVRGQGVVGQQPRLEPGKAFRYTSYCPLPTSWGTMEGTYTFKRDTGEQFDAAIQRFYLHVPKNVSVG